MKMNNKSTFFVTIVLIGIISLFLYSNYLNETPKNQFPTLKNRDDLSEMKDLLGLDIRKVREDFVNEGFYVSSIVDQTGKGKVLSMTVDLNRDNSPNLTKFSYATGIDIAPWKEGKITHLRIRSDLNYKIIETELR